MNQVIPIIIYDKIMKLTSESAERFGSTFERYSEESLRSSNYLERMEAIASVCRVKEASKILKKNRDQYQTLGIYDKGRYIHNILVSSKSIPLDSSEYSALTCYIALRDYGTTKIGGEIYKATIWDDNFYYHEFVIVGFLGTPIVQKHPFENLMELHEKFSDLKVKAEIPWIIDVTFDVVARMDQYHAELYNRMINKRLTGKVFSKIVPFIFSDEMIRHFHNFENYKNKDNYDIGEEISPVEYFNLMMRSRLIIRNVSRTTTEPTLLRRMWKI